MNGSESVKFAAASEGRGPGGRGGDMERWMTYSCMGDSYAYQQRRNGALVVVFASHPAMTFLRVILFDLG